MPMSARATCIGVSGKRPAQSEINAAIATLAQAMPSTRRGRPVETLAGTAEGDEEDCVAGIGKHDTLTGNAYRGGKATYSMGYNELMQCGKVRH